MLANNNNTTPMTDTDNKSQKSSSIDQNARSSVSTDNVLLKHAKNKKTKGKLRQNSSSLTLSARNDKKIIDQKNYGINNGIGLELVPWTTKFVRVNIEFRRIFS